MKNTSREKERGRKPKKPHWYGIVKLKLKLKPILTLPLSGDDKKEERKEIEKNPAKTQQPLTYPNLESNIPRIKKKELLFPET